MAFFMLYRKKKKMKEGEVRYLNSLSPLEKRKKEKDCKGYNLTKGLRKQIQRTNEIIEKPRVNPQQIP